MGNAGLGPSTEPYLVGSDGLMRSASRLFLQDPQGYRREAVAASTSPDVVERVIRLGTTTLAQPAATAGFRAAQRGHSGTVAAIDYTGNSEMEAFAPLNVPDSDLHWSIGCLRTIGQVQPNAGGQCGDDDFVMCVASMLLAQVMLRPVRRLQAGTRKISSGDYQVSIPMRYRDEIGYLTQAFNQMIRNLAIKDELLNEQRKENDRLCWR
ncbi:HAMP domain-containing protein [Mycobacterium tilburgii]|uniref:HAMP domain-containing protein n=1 Tax=Mycobacterium tilburgii TaxID=44467 RepID=UPI0021B330B9